MNGPGSPSTAEAGADPERARLDALLERSQALRASGEVARAIALGPQILEAYFRVERGRPLDRRAPRTFTEKLFCRMLDVHDHGCPTYSRLSDKLAVRDHVAQTVGEECLTPLLWHGDDPREIPWASLPDRAVLKCSEGSGKGTFLQRPVDVPAVEDLVRKWLADSYYWRRREYHYWTVPRRLLVEPFLEDGHPDGPLDYIFFCFDGIPRLLQVGSRSHTIHCFYTPAWEKLRLTYRDRYEAPDLPRPAMLDQMLDVAARLSAGFDFVRVDLYACGGRPRFGELTFTPRAGSLAFDPPDWDARLGDWWQYAGVPHE